MPINQIHFDFNGTIGDDAVVEFLIRNYDLYEGYTPDNARARFWDLLKRLYTLRVDNGYTLTKPYCGIELEAFYKMSFEGRPAYIIKPRIQATANHLKVDSKIVGTIRALQGADIETYIVSATFFEFIAPVISNIEAQVYNPIPVYAKSIPLANKQIPKLNGHLIGCFVNPRIA